MGKVLEGIGMIIKEEKKAFPPGTLVSSFMTPEFNCVVSTTWEGFFSWRLTTLISTWYIIENETSWFPFMKIIWKTSLKKAEIHRLHNEIVYGLDKMGEEGKDFASALSDVFNPIILADNRLFSSAVRLTA